MTKKIAIICEYKLFPERVGGMDYFFVAYDKALKERDYNVKWFFKEVIPFEFYKELNIENAKNSAVETFFLNDVYKNEIKYDIVITHFLQPVSSFFKKVKKLGNPYIINVDHNPRPLDGFPFKKRVKNRMKGILYAKYVDKLVGVSEYTKQQIINDFGKHLSAKTMVIYNGIDATLYKKGSVEKSLKPIKFIVVSHLRESKGIQDLLRALTLLDKDMLKHIYIDIFGEGPYKNKLLELQRTNHLEQIVHFKWSSPKINELLPKYHYMIQPTYMECFSLSILESLACNVPVITTTVGGNPEIIIDGENGFLFEPKNVAALAKIISDVVEGNKKIIDDVQGIIAQKYTLQHMVNNHLKYLP